MQQWKFGENNTVRVRPSGKLCALGTRAISRSAALADAKNISNYARLIHSRSLRLARHPTYTFLMKSIAFFAASHAHVTKARDCVRVNGARSTFRFKIRARRVETEIVQICTTYLAILAYRLYMLHQFRTPIRQVDISVVIATLNKT